MNKLTFNQIIIYILSILILFTIPIYTIAINNTTLKDGTEYLFKVEAFDPYDMFRGNYLNISFKEDTVKSTSIDYQNNKKNEYYVTIGIGTDGFAYFTDISLTKPEDTSNYYKTTGYYKTYAEEYSIDTPSRSGQRHEKIFS